MTHCNRVAFSNADVALVPLLCLLLAAAPPALAADDQGKLDFKQRVYINGGVGVTRIEPESSTDALTVSDNSDAGGHLGIGFDLNRFLSIEAYAADLGTANIEFLGTPAGTVDYTVFGASALGYLFNSRSGFVLGDSDAEGLYRREGLSLYGRLGIGHLRNDSSNVQSNRDYTSHVAFGAGLEYGFRNGFAVRTELMALDTDARYLNVGLLKRFGHVPAVAPPFVEAPKAALPVLEAPEPVPPKAPIMFKPVVAPFIYFEVDVSDLTSESVVKLNSFVDALKDKDFNVQVNGYTDWIAAEDYNVSLSIRRAEAVANYLVSKGIESDRITIMGFGELQPASNNNTAEGRMLNRRSEIVLQ